MIGTSASAGWRPLQKNANHETLPAASRYGQKLLTRARRSAEGERERDGHDQGAAAAR